MPKPAILVLEDGTVFRGTSFGAAGEVDGEVVFNTSMTGYQEILTDPSYAGQMVTMTYPLIGNYGINLDDSESGKPQVRALIVREPCRKPSNHLSTIDLAGYLKENNVIGLAGIDTRKLTRHIRLKGAMKAVLSTTSDDVESLVEKARFSPGLVGRDMVKEVTSDKPYEWHDGFTSRFAEEVTERPAEGCRVVALDYGVKYNILRHLVAMGCQVTVLPASTDAVTILGMKPDGVFLSNGPGDPAAVTYAIDTISGLVGKVPIFGICLGHQLLCLALGAKTYKLKFGHRGANQPVKNLSTGRVEITSQNHGFAVETDSLPRDVEETHINLNDQTNEGVRHKKLPAFSVQYHPEASPGPHDASYLFKEFAELMTGK